MRRLALSLSICLLAVSASAQELGGPKPVTPPIQLDLPLAVEDLPPTRNYYRASKPEQPNPYSAVHAAAAERAKQREMRISARKWYGFSNARPVASHSPHTAGSYSPSWTAGSLEPFDWAAFGWGSVQPRSTMTSERRIEIKQ